VLEKRNVEGVRIGNTQQGYAAVGGR
jgi:hypothetical protein